MKFIAISMIFSLVFGPAAFAQQNAQGNSPSFKMSGQAQLHNNFIHKGLTQTKKDPALNGEFRFNFGPQFSLGLWGSNVSYENEDVHFWMRIFASIKLNFTENFEGELVYYQHQFYKTNTRNGNTLGLHFNIFKYLVIYDMDSNWEGTQQGDQYVAFGKTFDVFGNDWKWENLVGYTMLSAQGSSNYFNFETFIGRQWTSLYPQLGLTGTTNQSQFNGRGDYQYVIKIATKF